MKASNSHCLNPTKKTNVILKEIHFSYASFEASQLAGDLQERLLHLPGGELGLDSQAGRGPGAPLRAVSGWTSCLPPHSRQGVQHRPYGELGVVTHCPVQITPDGEAQLECWYLIIVIIIELIRRGQSSET